MAETVSCPTCGRSTPDSSFCQFCGKALYSCSNCRASLLRESMFCPECGQLVSGEGREMISREHVSWAWWLLPLLFPVVLAPPWAGGLVAWAFNRRRNARQATLMLWLGISLSVILFVVGLVLGYTTR